VRVRLGPSNQHKACGIDGELMPFEGMGMADVLPSGCKAHRASSGRVRGGRFLRLVVVFLFCADRLPYRCYGYSPLVPSDLEEGYSTYLLIHKLYMEIILQPVSHRFRSQSSARQRAMRACQLSPALLQVGVSFISDGYRSSPGIGGLLAL